MVKTHMTTDAYSALIGTTPAEKLASQDIIPGKSVNINDLASVALRFDIAVYLFFENDLVRNQPLEVVIHKYKDIPEFERPYVRVEAFLRFVKDNDPSFETVMRERPIMVEIVKIDEIDADPKIPPLVYVTALMPFSDELNL
jgi:hypothetical protein